MPGDHYDIPEDRITPPISAASRVKRDQIWFLAKLAVPGPAYSQAGRPSLGMPSQKFGNCGAVIYSGRDMDTRTIAVIALIVAVVVLILIL